MFKVTLQGHSETQGHISRSHTKVTFQGHTSRSLENSRSHFKVTFHGWHRRSVLKVVWQQDLMCYLQITWPNLY
ncbi:unnamed protein product [Acanthoscelides obtectus]|uniref:Uncharacterized protein n=1 Tax=Acanthoscelides obtectus TaxID=200917 RepID=A0A9P0LGR5_ACAOB|nr:unnamed protein product [Acanthoscelides obtectus]CAK1629537.1 hypothetical protein AOBTE_LOCUS5803 [Acanthoscelides obtectus]